jgi:hypothetical protein
VAVERSDRDVVALIKRERLAGRVPVSHGGVVAQVWRGGTGRHLAVARLLAGTDIAAPDDRLRRRASVLLARSGLADAIDVAVASLAADGEDLFTLRSWRPPGTGSGCGRTRRPHSRIAAACLAPEAGPSA